MEGNSYLAYVAWSKIKEPVNSGGLGFLDLTNMNDALLMKSLWRLAAGTCNQWTDIVRAKYMPQSLLWHTKRSYNCSLFWRSILKLREKLLPFLSWKLGSGGICGVFGQPWCPGAMNFVPPSRNHAKKTVQSLTKEYTQTWDVEQLVELFGYTQAMRIISTVSVPVQHDTQDKLMFLPAADGTYSVKHGYRLLSSFEEHSGNQGQMWKAVWKKGTLLPRIRLFLWKILNRALPLGKILHARMCSRDPLCATCGEAEEDVTHMLFQCTFSRVCWYAGAYPLKSDELMSDPTEAIKQLIQNTDDTQWTTVGNTMWAIWRCRNEQAYEGKRPTIKRFRQCFREIQRETMLAESALKPNGTQLEKPRQQDTDKVTCFTDGAWSQEWRGGIGFVIQKGETLIAYRSASATVCCPLQAEAKALQAAMEQVISDGINSCTFYMDSQILVNVCKAYQPPTDVDWRAFQELYQCWLKTKEHNEFVCEHVPRSCNSIADQLARMGKQRGWNHLGYTYPWFNE